MLFAIYAKDKPNALEVRMTNRAAHLEYVAQLGSVVKVAGPLLADDGETLIGSLLIIEFDTGNEAEQWMALDPYSRAGLFESVEIHPWKWLIGAPEEE